MGHYYVLERGAVYIQTKQILIKVNSKFIAENESRFLQMKLWGWQISVTAENVWLRLIPHHRISVLPPLASKQQSRVHSISRRLLIG